MYKVFIDNKPILFTENWKKTKQTADFLLINTKKLQEIDLVKCRIELPNGIDLIVQTKDPERAIREAFAAYDFIQASGGIVKRKTRYLFIERHGLWDIPKGKMEDGESPGEAAVREIEEECGINAPKIERLIGITYHTYEFKGRPTLKKNWWYALSYNGPKELVPQTEEAITQAVWLSKKEWATVRANTYASIEAVLDMAK